MVKIRDKIGGEMHEKKKHHSSHSKLSERLYKIVMIFGLGITYKGLKGWLKSKKRRMTHR